MQRSPKYFLHQILNIYPYVNLNKPGNIPKDREWCTEWNFVHLVIKRTPQGMYHDPLLTVYHMLDIGKQLDSYLIIISRELLDPILTLSLYLSILTWPFSPPSMTNIRWWCSVPGSQAKDTLSSIPMGLYATLDHYVLHPITIYPPSRPVHLTPTMSPSSHRLRRSPPPPSKSYPPVPPNTLFRRAHVPSPILLARASLLTTSVKF